MIRATRDYDFRCAFSMIDSRKARERTGPMRKSAEFDETQRDRVRFSRCVLDDVDLNRVFANQSTRTIGTVLFFLLSLRHRSRITSRADEASDYRYVVSANTTLFADLFPSLSLSCFCPPGSSRQIERERRKMRDDMPGAFWTLSVLAASRINRKNISSVERGRSSPKTTSGCFRHKEAPTKRIGSLLFRRSILGRHRAKGSLDLVRMSRGMSLETGLSFYKIVTLSRRRAA